MAIASDAGAWNKYAANVKKDYEDAVKDEKTALDAYWSSIKDYVDAATNGW